MSAEILEKAARGTGPTTRVVTRLSGPPQAGRALSVAAGEGADALAAAGREGLQAFTGQVPTALLSELEGAGLAVRSTTHQAGAVATEVRFLPQATEYIVPFLE